MAELNNFDLVKRLCRLNRYAQLGDYWFENKTSYGIIEVLCQALFFVGIYALCILETTEILMNSYPEELHGDALALGIVHIIIISRFHCLQLNRKLIQKLHYEVAMEDGKFKIRDERLLKKQFKKIRDTVVIPQSIVIATTVLAYLVEGCRRFYQNKMPFIILPIYWPPYGSTSSLSICIHVLFFFVLASMMVALVSADTLAVSHLIMICYKLRSLRHYFGKLEEEFESKQLSTLELKQMTLDGVLEHRKMLQLTHKVRACFGVMMSLQVIQGSGVMFLLLVKIALTKDMKFSAVVLNTGFMIALFMQLGVYLWNAGEVTYQASLIPDAIFHCGWHLRSVRDEGGRDLRRIVLMGCAQSQQPLILKAFGIQALSYTAYVSILKTTYSIFAVLFP